MFIPLFFSLNYRFQGFRSYVYLLNLFSAYTPYFGHEKIRIANGTFSTIVGKGVISTTSSMSFPSVLHVSSFTSNLLSISHITRNLNYSATFFPSCCVCQDLTRRRMIGSGREEHGLYLLDISDKEALYTTISENKFEDIWLWH